MITTVFIAFGLAADAFAASITSGIKIKRLRIKNALMIATFFGFFQTVMPLVGWLVGRSLKGLISEVDHWVAFGLLTFVGCRMIYESIHSETIRSIRAISKLKRDTRRNLPDRDGDRPPTTPLKTRSSS